MGNSTSAPRTAEMPPRPPVAEGKTRICVAGFSTSHHTNRAGKIARTICAARPAAYECWFFFNSKLYRSGLEGDKGVLGLIKKELNEQDQATFAAHKSSPFVWLEKPDGSKQALGGRDRFSEWAGKQFPEDKELAKLLSSPNIWELNVDCTPGTAPTQ